MKKTRDGRMRSGWKFSDEDMKDKRDGAGGIEGWSREGGMESKRESDAM